MCLEAERLTNEVITADLPMITRHFDTFEEAAKEPMRKKLTVERDITLVGIGKPEYDWGCVACCGTHPATTGQVGLVKIFKLEHNKDMYRIYFEAGRRAFEKYQQQFEALNTLCGKLSAGTDDVLDKFLSLQEKNKEVRNQLHFLKKMSSQKKANPYLQNSQHRPALRRPAPAPKPLHMQVLLRLPAAVVLVPIQLPPSRRFLCGNTAC